MDEASNKEGGKAVSGLGTSESSIHPSYTKLLSFPYDVICRQRLARKKRAYARQFNRELNHMIALKVRAIDGIRLDLLFTMD
ncbi:uncharacterized protein LOC106635703 [Copidosoma floridanum]|uniref:uncharacterized protein LOC106635703 n=1 Tax=Copidosoma floridanum TaxID=29053 RepID=UPI0006C95736|nr:uncharacterized protein LOC106635703 [Copidosoma floridanum]